MIAASLEAGSCCVFFVDTTQGKNSWQWSRNGQEMADTPPSAHKSEPLTSILNSLNDPKGVERFENAEKGAAADDEAKNSDYAINKNSWEPAEHKNSSITNSSTQNNVQRHQSMPTAGPVAARTSSIFKNSSQNLNVKNKELVIEFSSSSSDEIDWSDNDDIHRWFNSRDWQYTNGVYRCSVCNVHLCVPCFQIFHEERDIIGKREILMTEMEKHWKQRPRKKS
jgi:hypothetical protein